MRKILSAIPSMGCVQQIRLQHRQSKHSCGSDGNLDLGVLDGSRTGAEQTGRLHINQCRSSWTFETSVKMARPRLAPLRIR